MIRAVIFDFNGVLVDDEHVHFALFRDVVAEQGIRLTEQQYYEVYLGYDDRGCFEHVLRDAGQPFDTKRIDELIAQKARRYALVAETGLRIFPGAVDCVSSLASRWPLAVNSGALRPEIEFALQRMRVRQHVAAIVSAEDTARCKPDPEGYTLALEALRALPGFSLADLQADECLVIEDSRAGLESARGAGMHAIGISHTYPADELLPAGAEHVIASLGTLTPAWVEQQF